MDGKYVADGRVVRRNPEQTEAGVTMGIAVCEVFDYVDDKAAQEIADALNAHAAQVRGD